jgi:alpha-D-ribose 1-methylphosphonate 5-triphosphate synthase subunit PhnH
VNGSQILRGVNRKIPGNISPLHNGTVRFHSPLHDAAGSLILSLHDVAGSQFGSGESSLNTLKDFIGP